MQASEALSDGSSDVRRKAVRLVWALGLQHPEKSARAGPRIGIFTIVFSFYNH